ncbi:FAD/NAD(P)-binding domain-containing protein [Clavulina sp. PMI_390]|nr:FAD/NAD(P)-binding domain-containing protein [Clavulina sp. PMI_390]
MRSSNFLLISSLCWAFVAGAPQQPLKPQRDLEPDNLYYELPNDIRRVAVIGAGPAGLIFASTLIKHGFEVRMFERAPNPGGVWHYTDKVPIPASIPNRPIETMAYVPDIPKVLPTTRTYTNGDDGLTIDWRIREHWNPSPVWRNMLTTAPHQLLSLPDVGYPKNTPWKLHQIDMNRHVRQYASSVGLNVNDEEHANITAYWTRVERVEKVPGTERRWTVTLRKLTPLGDGKLEAHWWQEEFDAVVVGHSSEYDAAWLPTIPGLKDWMELLPNSVFHSRQYRHPQDFTNKNVLILGGGYSGVGIANDLIGHARSVMVSARKPSPHPFFTTLRGMFHKNVTIVPEVAEFGNRPSAIQSSLRDASLILANDSVASGFDAIILATGHRKSLPFLVGLHNSTIQGRDEPETKVSPVITDGTHLRSLHWTGHYIDDPTLLLSTESPWRDGAGEYQALGAARVWSRTARLPSIARMWQTYPGAVNQRRTLPLLGQSKWQSLLLRLFATWLNNEILEFGGSLVSPPAATG